MTTKPHMRDSYSKILAAALLWARNHLEVGRPELRDRVIETLDRVLKYREPTVADMKRFRELFGTFDEQT